jgi:hypothetical protein
LVGVRMVSCVFWPWWVLSYRQVSTLGACACSLAAGDKTSRNKNQRLVTATVFVWHLRWLNDRLDSEKRANESTCEIRPPTQAEETPPPTSDRLAAIFFIAAERI